MMFEHPKIIYIHMPKTGGSSIETYLNKCNVVKKRNGHMGQHAALSRAYDIHGDSIYDYKMFTVIRNTYERILSIYCFFYVRNGSGFIRMGIDKSKAKDDKIFITFPQFYTRLLELYRDGTPVTYAEDFFYYCGIDGKIPEEMEVLRFDKIKEDFEHMWRNKWEFKMPMPLPHVNDNVKVPTDDKLREYLGRDPKFIEVVNEIYEKEIEYFDFKPPYS